MKHRNTAAVLLAALMASTVVVGCSSTPTQQSAGQAVDDGVVTAKVKAALVADPVTKAHQINVETFKGTVQLSGFVETDEARTRALQLARDMEGVKKSQGRAWRCDAAADAVLHVGRASARRSEAGDGESPAFLCSTALQKARFVPLASGVTPRAYTPALPLGSGVKHLINEEWHRWPIRPARQETLRPGAGNGGCDRVHAPRRCRPRMLPTKPK